LNDGSVQHLDFLAEHDKEVFKTAVEIDQSKLIDLAADRQEYICQAQSYNLFLPPNVDVKVLHQLHFSAWKKGLKSMYYLRSDANKGTEKIGNRIERVVREEAPRNPDIGCVGCEG